MAICKQAHPIVTFPPPTTITSDPFNGWRRKDKVVVVMGATGTGKSRLSIDLATRFPAEIINSDKMQVYQGLDITTNKVTKEEKRGIPHHLLGVIDPEDDFTATDFRLQASMAVDSIVKKDCLPIIVGGSNSYIESLIDDENLEFRSKYDCCFLWVDVSLPVLNSFVSDRVDRMVEYGLLDEVERIFKTDGDYAYGIRRAIGVPELDLYFRYGASSDEETRSELLRNAIDDIKRNNCVLAQNQLKKINRLRRLPGWNINRINATDVLLSHGRNANDKWEHHVARPSTMIVSKFLFDNDYYTGTTITTSGSAISAVMGTPIAAAAAAR
ncbi:hypothetical protein ACHQM5_027021 [Ranunculus cassubicifolius]